jgi:hypothetical protein
LPIRQEKKPGNEREDATKAKLPAPASPAITGMKGIMPRKMEDQR